MLLTPSRRVGVEAVGSAFLLMAIVGSGVMGDRLASGNVAVALLANTLATSLALAWLIATLGPLSGAHLNPLVSLVAWWSGHLRASEAIAYGMAQVLGSILGVWLVHTMFGLPTVEVSTHARAGAPQIVAEAVATFGLLSVIDIGSKVSRAAVPALVACYIGAAYWFTSSTSFANPAVTIARALTDTFAGIRPSDVPGFLAGQIVGAGIAVTWLRWLWRGRLMKAS